MNHPRIIDEPPKNHRRNPTETCRKAYRKGGLKVDLRWSYGGLTVDLKNEID
jgi:hypothetical protein